MKSMSKKLLAVIMSLVLLLCAIPLQFAVAAEPVASFSLTSALAITSTEFSLNLMIDKANALQAGVLLIGYDSKTFNYVGASPERFSDNDMVIVSPATAYAGNEANVKYLSCAFSFSDAQSFSDQLLASLRFKSKTQVQAGKDYTFSLECKSLMRAGALVGNLSNVVAAKASNVRLLYKAINPFVIIDCPDSSEEAKIVGFNSTLDLEQIKALELPEKWGSKTVVELDYVGDLFGKLPNLQYVYIPKSIERLSANLFSECKKIEYIEVASGNPAFFSSCGVLYENLKDENEEGFSESIIRVYPNARTDSKFITSNELTNFSLDRNVAKENSFVKEVVFGSGVSTVDNNVYSFFPKLEKISVLNGNYTFCSADGVLYSEDMTKLYKYPNLKSGDKYVIPESVTAVEKYAIYNVQGLKRISLPRNAVLGLDSIRMPSAIVDGYFNRSAYELFSNDFSIFNYQPTKPSLAAGEYSFCPLLGKDLVLPLKYNYMDITDIRIDGKSIDVKMAKPTPNNISLPVSLFNSPDWLETSKKIEFDFAMGTGYGIAVNLYVTKAHEHAYSKWTVDRQSNCTQKGQESAACIYCNEVASRELPIAPEVHSYGDYLVKTQASCTQKGVAAKYCIRCNHEVTVDIPQHLLSWSGKTEWVKSKIAFLYVCRCADEGDKIIDTNKSAHKHSGTKISAVFEADCDEAGYVVEFYTGCGCGEKTIKQQALGHSFGEWLIVTPVTASEDGLRQRECSVCGYKESEVIKADEPTTKPAEPTTKPTEPTTKPTEPTTKPVSPTAKPTEPPLVTKPKPEPTTGPNSQTVTLKIKSDAPCAFDDSGKYIVFTQGKLTVAEFMSFFDTANIKIVNSKGEEQGDSKLVGTGSRVQLFDAQGSMKAEYPVILFMDTNGDGKVAAADARIALRASAKLDKLEGIYLYAADANGDGAVKAADARALLRTAANLAQTPSVASAVSAIRTIIDNDSSAKADEGAKVYVSQKGSVYHFNPSCSGMKSPDSMSRGEAESKGLAPCSKCVK